MRCEKSGKSSSVAVIIPFFQRESGILTRALDTVAAQTHRNIRIIIVDDESPRPPHAEIAARPEEEIDTITLLRRPNGGPAAARNTALDSVPAEVDYIAFLDSDDRWKPRHLERAVEGLDAGFDFFFADYTWPGATTTCFYQAGLLATAVPIRGGSDIAPLKADFYETILSSWPVRLSATVVRARTLGDLRFDERLKFSSEDMCYFLHCARRTDRVCYSTALGVHLGGGPGMFRHQTLGSYAFSRSRLDNAYFHRQIEAEAAARGRIIKAINRRMLKANYRDFLRSEIKSLLHDRRLNIDLYADFFRVLLGRDFVPRGQNDMRLSEFW